MKAKQYLQTGLLLASTLLASSPAFAYRTVGNQIDEAIITTKVINGLSKADTIPLDSLNLHTYKHNVQVCGYVEKRPEIKTIRKIVKNTKGVDHYYENISLFENIGDMVRSKLHPVNHRTLEDEALVDMIAKKINASTDIYSDDMSVLASDGIVTICGFSNNNSQIRQIERLVKSTTGVRSVRNNLINKQSV